MIYITGDTHGSNDFYKLAIFSSAIKPKRRDCLFILGDAGICWDKYDFKVMELLYSSIGCTVFFIDGNHENFDMIEQFPIVTKYGARMHKISKYIYHIMRGEVLNIKNLKILCIGGACSIDIWNRRAGISWWPQEEIRKSDVERGLQNVKKYNNEVDYVFTHCAETATVNRKLHFRADVSTDWLVNIERHVRYRKWLFGHYHKDKQLTENKICIYQEIYRLNEDGEMEKLKLWK